MRLALLLVLALGSGCAHEVIELGPAPSPIPAVRARLELTVTVVAGSFDASRLSPEGVAQHFADGLRAAGLYFWKSALGNALPPFLFFIHLENDYELELTALLLRRREIVATYEARAAIRHRYQAHADRTAMENEALASLARRATHELLSRIALDLERLRTEDQRRTGR